MTSFEPGPPGGHAPGQSPPDALDSYAIHVLPALDGVLLYLTLRGEHVGTYFGTTERAAAAAAAAALVDRVTAPDDEVDA
jgi:hypothetical protein